ncbi:MAG: alpha/beta hydrolase [Oligoflexia bacterium]|nr:alpha/beta hydrolase [Oligoflexia bacterium]
MPQLTLPERSDLKLYYELHGSAGEPIVLLNGVMMNTRAWGALLPAFAAKHRVLLHDFRGQGLSSQPDEPYSYELHVRDLLALLDHLGIDKTHLIGTSYGSEVGLAFAIRHPERVLTLTVAAGVARPDALLRAKIRAWILATEHAITHGEKRDLYLSTVPYNFSASYLRERGAFFDKMADAVARLPDTWFVGFKRLCEAFLELDVLAGLPRITAPTLIVAGTQDELKPVRFSRELAERIPHARLELIDAAHALVIEKPEEFTALVLEFLKHSPVCCP